MLYCEIVLMSPLGKCFSFVTAQRFLISSMRGCLSWGRGEIEMLMTICCCLPFRQWALNRFAFEKKNPSGRFYLVLFYLYLFSISSACCLKSVCMQPVGDRVIPPACRHVISSASKRLHFIYTLLFSSPGPGHPLLPWFQLKQELVGGC